MKVHQIFKEPGNMHKVLPEYLSLWTTQKVANEGVHVMSNAEVQDVSLDGKQVCLHLNGGKKVSCPVGNLCVEDKRYWLGYRLWETKVLCVLSDRYQQTK